MGFTNATMSQQALARTEFDVGRAVDILCSQSNPSIQREDTSNTHYKINEPAIVTDEIFSTKARKEPTPLSKLDKDLLLDDGFGDFNDYRDFQNGDCSSFWEVPCFPDSTSDTTDVNVSVSNDTTHEFPSLGDFQFPPKHVTKRAISSHYNEPSPHVTPGTLMTRSGAGLSFSSNCLPVAGSQLTPEKKSPPLHSPKGPLKSPVGGLKSQPTQYVTKHANETYFEEFDLLR
ncbi:hypothetical protein K7432_013431 [Basidiobolus ranarum]|uniref:UBA domain-containing protein n=1 Tax=Basidiobolus ranarum TaxID=34480 RepID=A0ABR2VRS7_9FUNG